MSSNISDYCENIFNLLTKECEKRGNSSHECCLLKRILNRKCMNETDDCIKIKTN